MWAFSSTKLLVVILALRRELDVSFPVSDTRRFFLVSSDSRIYLVVVIGM